MKMTVAADIPWKPANPKKPNGVQMYAVDGNPSEGAFTAVLKVPEGHVNPPHKHSANTTAVVLAGTVNFGRSADDNQTLSAGSAWTVPAGEIHFGKCASEGPCQIFIAMDGKMETIVADGPHEGEMKGKVMPASTLEWKKMKPDNPKSPEIVVLDGDMKKGPFKALARLPIGFDSGLHSHTANFSAAIISGTLRRGKDTASGVQLSTGAVWTQPGGEVHVDSCVSEDAPCDVVIVMDGAMDSIKPPAQN